MGAGQGTELRLIDHEIELRRETRDFARWSLSDVQHLYQRFQTTFGLSITENEFHSLLLLKAPETISSKELFHVLDTNHDGRIDGLEFIAALICIARATFEEKAHFAFELFDFNRNGFLSLTELALLMKSVWVGMSLFTTLSLSLLSSQSFLQLAQHAFDRYDRDQGESLQYEEFIEWARSNRSFMLQVEQFRMISEKAIGKEDNQSIPDGSDLDSDVEEEEQEQSRVVPLSTASSTRQALFPAPWLLEPSTNDTKPNTFPPPVHLEMEWIYGYPSTQHVRNTIRILRNGDIVYIVSKFAIIYTPTTHRQRHFIGHKYPITCLDVHPSGLHVATGDSGDIQTQGSLSEIRVWDGISLTCLAVLTQFHTSGIACVAFPSAKSQGRNEKNAGTTSPQSKSHTNLSPDTALVTIGNDKHGSLAVWDWPRQQLVASGRAMQDTKTQCSTSQTSKPKRVLCVAVSSDCREIVVGGEHFLAFHHVHGRSLSLKRPKGFGTDQKVGTMPLCLCATYFGDSVVVGTALGQLFQFQQHQLVRVVQGHAIGQSINICQLSCQSMILMTAGKDGILKQWDSTLHPIGAVIDLHGRQPVAALTNEDFRIHSLAYDATRQCFVVGTRQGHLLEIEESHNTSSRILASSHRGASIHGIATCRFGLCFATCSVMDKHIRVWDVRRRIETSRVSVLFEPNTLVFSSDGEWLAVGGRDGSIAIFRVIHKKLVLTKQIKNTESSVQTLRFHPSTGSASSGAGVGQILLAVACLNGLIYLYRMDETTMYLYRHALLKPSNEEEITVATSMDFSVDGQFLKSQHGLELRFWDLRAPNTVTRISTYYSVRNVQWQTYTSTIGWHLHGLDLEPSKHETVTTNAAQTLVATMDGRTGDLSLYHFPLTAQPLAKTVHLAHCHAPSTDSTVSAGFALHDTLFLSSYGEQGSVVCQWRVLTETSDVQPRPVTSSVEWVARLAPFGQSHIYTAHNTVKNCYCSRQESINPPALPHTASAGLSVQQSRSEAPDLDLSISYVHGLNYRYSGLNQVCIATLDTNTNRSQLVYAAGTLLVTCQIGSGSNPCKQTQVIVSGVSKHITSIVRQSNSVLAVAARGEPQVQVWQWEGSCAQRISTLQAPAHSSDCALHILTAFEATDMDDVPPRDLAIVVWKQADRHVLCIYHWKSGNCLAQADMTTLPVLFGLFTRSSSSDTVSFVSGGVDHLQFWTMNPATRHVRSQQGVFGRHALVSTALCGASASPYILTGMENGSIIVWDHAMAAYAFNLTESKGKNEKETGTAVISLLVVPGRRCVVVAQPNGVVTLLAYAQENDPTKYRANTFMSVLQTLNVWDWNWGLTQPPKERPLVQTITALEELQAGLAVVLTSGIIFHVDTNALSTRIQTPVSAQVVVDVGFDISATAAHLYEPNILALGYTNGRVRIWSMSTQSILAEVGLDSHIHALAWHPQTKHLAVSLATGHLVILSWTDTSLSIVTPSFPCGSPQQTSSGRLKKWCTCLRLHSSGSQTGDNTTSWLAAACRDYHIYVYKLTASMQFELVHDFSGHTAPIIALDFSIDGTWLQSATSSTDRQLRRWKVVVSDVPNKEVLADNEWSSWTVGFTGPCAGLCERFGQQATTVDRILQSSQNTVWSSLLPTIVIGTDSGQVVLGWYPLPCGQESRDAMFKSYDGYYSSQSMVFKAQFSANNTFVVTQALCEDGSQVVVVWKTDYEEEIRQRERLGNPASSEALIEIPSLPLNGLVEDVLDQQNKRQAIALEHSGDEFLAVKPWVGSIREPTIIPVTALESRTVDSDLTLEFVYGVHPANISYADDTWEIVYSAASFGIVYNTKSKTQLLNAAHTGQLVTALAVHPRGDLVVTGEVAQNKTKPARLVAWDANTGATISTIETVHTQGVGLIAVSPSGTRIATIGLDSDHTLALYKLEDRGIRSFQLLATSKSTKQVVHSLQFHHENDEELVTGGHKHVLFWNSSAATKSEGMKGNSSGLTLSMKKGLYGAHSAAGANAIVLAAVYISSRQGRGAASHVVTGQHDGALALWKARQCVTIKNQAHTGHVYALAVDRNKPHVVYSSGQDGKICTWNAQLDLLSQIDVTTLNHDLGKSVTNGLVKSLFTTEIKSICTREGRILFTTEGGDIGELIPDTTTAVIRYRLQVHLSSHCKGELWGLATHPAKLQFVTAGDDGSVRIWDAPSRELLACYQAAKGIKYRTVAYSSDGSHIAVGSHDGSITILMTEDLCTVVTTWKCSAKAIAVLKYDPQGRFLAIGAHDQSIYIVNAHTYKLIGVCAGHSSTVSHLDFAKEGSVLQSTSNAGELLFWRMDMDPSESIRTVKNRSTQLHTFDQIKSATTVRDTVWSTWTLPYGWPVQGIWPPGSDGSDINAVARSEDERMLAVGDDDGLVKLFRYPCVVASKAKTFIGHASHVTNCCFTKQDMYLITTGGLDNTICQYRQHTLSNTKAGVGA